ncbi:hypothetical protein QQ045_002793 [Rhodiola kirilowii]
MKIILASLLILTSMTLCVNIGVAKGNTFCVAKPSTSDVELLNNIKYVCETLKHNNCKNFIDKGGCCFEPNTLINHASVLMNAYYAENGRNSWNCDFKGSGLVTITDPSYSQCKYE